MSTNPTVIEHIRQLVEHEKLFPYVLAHRRPKRRLFLTAGAFGELTRPDSAFGVLGVQPKIHVVFEHWVRGLEVWVDPDGKPRLLKPLFPPEPDVFELMILEPGAQVRAFCLFAEPDTLIVSHMNTRQLLGKRNSQQWRDAKALCMENWSDLFNSPPFRPAGPRPHNLRSYVTENCDDLLIK